MKQVYAFLKIQFTKIMILVSIFLIQLIINSCIITPYLNLDDHFHAGIEIESTAINNPPQISSFSNINISIGEVIGQITFSVDESNNPAVAEEDEQKLMATVTSSNQALISDASLTLGYVDNGAGDASSVVATLDIETASLVVGTSTITVTVTEIEDISKSTTSSFTVTVVNPLAEINDLQLWLRADRGVYNDSGITLAQDGQTVQQWHDISGNGHILTALAGAGTEPIFNQVNIGNKPSLHFDGGNDRLAKTPFTGPTNALTAFVVANHEAGDTSQGTFEISNGAVNTGINNVLSGGNNTLRIRAGGSNNINTPMAFPATKIFSFIYSGSSRESISYWNGVQVGVFSNMASTLDNVLNRIDVGTHVNVAGWEMKGNISELIIYYRALTISERQKVEAYLSNRYGIQVAPSDNQKLWLKADSGVTNDVCGGTTALNAQTVACWGDQSGNNNHASTIFGSPIFSASLADGTPNSILFDGSSHFEVGAAATWSFLHSGRAHSEFLIFKTTSTNPSTTFSLIDTKSSAAANLGFNLGYNDASNDAISVLISEGASSSTISHSTADNAVPAGNWNLVTHELTTASTSHLITTGSLASSISTGSTFNQGSPAGTLALGSDSASGNNGLIGNLAEIIIYDASMTHTDRQRTEYYLADKYNITYASHPVLNQPGLKMWLKADSGVVTSRTNMLFRSEEIDSASWTTALGASVTANQIANPINGNVDVERINDNGSTVAAYANQIIAGIQSNTTYTISAFVKQNTAPDFTIAFFETVANTFRARADFDWVGGVPVLASLDDGQNPKIEDYGSGWYRVSVSTLATGVNSGNPNWMLLYPSRHGLNQGAVSTYFWGAQVEDNVVATTYIPTTATPVTVDGGAGQVSAWTDQGPYGNSASQTTAVSRPIWVADGGVNFGHRPVIHFDGSNDYLDVMPQDSMNVLSGHTVFLVYSMLAAGNKVILEKGANIKIMLQSDAAGTYYLNDNTSRTTALVNGDIFNGNPNLLSMIYDSVGPTKSLYLNGVNKHNDTPIAGPASNVTIMNIGGRGATLNQLGDISEIIIYSEALSTSQRQQVECYLSAKYNITVVGCPL